MNAPEPIVLELEEVPPKASESTALTVTDHSPMGRMMVAMERGANIEQIERMLAIQERWEANEARKAYHAAMAAFKAEAVEIIKRKRVHFTSQKGTTDYKHAELSDVMEAVGPALSKHGFAWTYKTEQKDRAITVTCVLTHAQGHSESVTLSGAPDETGNKNSIQAIASTCTYLQRHTLKLACGVAEKGDDNDGHGDSDKQAADWLARVQEATTEDELRQVSREGSQAFTKAKDVPGYASFMKAVQKRGAEIKGAGHA